jgi:hypothetical protein
VAVPARLFELEYPMEERVARLEAKVDHIQSDISDMKVDIRKLDEKIDRVDQKLTAKIDSLLEMIVSLRVGRAFDRVWWLLMSAALLGIMARAFKWI